MYLLLTYFRCLVRQLNNSLGHLKETNKGIMKIPWHNTVPKEIQDFKQAEGIYTTFNKLSKGSKIL
jgi:hypothetical protein